MTMPQPYTPGPPRRDPLEDVPGGYNGGRRPRGTRERPEPEAPCGEPLQHFGEVCACNDYGARDVSREVQ